MRTPALVEWDDWAIGRRRTAGAPLARGLYVGFRARDRAQVDAFWQAGVDAGYRDDGAPGPRTQYGPTYYGAFLLDPDGNSVEAVHNDREHAVPDGRIDHLWIRVRDLEASRRFYTTIAPHAGLRLTHDEPGPCGLSGTDYSFSLVRDERPPTEHLHLAFPASEDAAVRAFHAAALAAGYEDNGAPGERAVYHSGYYAAFVLDPTGTTSRSSTTTGAEPRGTSPRTTGGTSSVVRSRRAQRRWLEPRAPWPMTTEIAQFMRKLEGRWDDHLEALLTRHDVDGAMADMTAATSLRHIPDDRGRRTARARALLPRCDAAASARWSRIHPTLTDRRSVPPRR